MRRLARRLPLVLMVLVPLTLAAQLKPAVARQVADLAQRTLAETAAPSVSFAIVKDNQIYTQAFGHARLTPPAAARPDMRYKIGSVSKQFMAAALVMLAGEHRLSLDDAVGRYLPELTRADEVTIRELLTHTSGYQDYYPLDYVAPFMLQPVTADDILDRWAKKPLDFDPGTRWQYSNTNYVIAGRILEKVTGAPFLEFLQRRIFRPLGMNTVVNLDDRSLGADDAVGYTRYGLGPWRPVPPEARNWLFAAGELAMTAGDLARWDRALLAGTLLNAALLRQMMTPATLKSGAPTGYGLGVNVGNADGFPLLSHGGAVSGFGSENAVWLGQGVAVAAFTNADGSPAPAELVRRLGPLLLSRDDPQAGAELRRSERVFAELQQGRIDRSLLTADAKAFFTPQVLADARASLGPLGRPKTFAQTGVELRGGMTYRHFLIRFQTGRALRLSTFTVADGRLDQFLIQ